MKILFIAPSLCALWGGTTVAILSIYHALKKQGAWIELWSTRSEHDKISPELLDDKDIKFFDSVTNWRYSINLQNELERRVREFDIAHIHGMWLYPHYVAAKIAKKYSIPYLGFCCIFQALSIFYKLCAFNIISFFE